MNLFVRSKIKDVCNEKNMTLAELGRQAEVTRWMLSRPDANFRLDTIARIITALDCKFEDAFEIVVINDVK